MTAAILLALLGYASSTPDVVWTDAYDATHAGVTVARSARYGVWVWAKDSEPVAVTLQNVSFTGPVAPNVRGNYVWRKIGEALLQSGTFRADASASVATIVLAVNPQYDPAAAMAQIRVLNKPEPVTDRRVDTYRESSSYSIFPAYASRAAWDKRVEEIHLHLRIAGGLVPMPDRTPLNAHVFDETAHDDYIVAKVTFESRPGFLVTGNLYRPKGDGPFPAIVNPHGHWNAGRLENTDITSVPARCITFARMGIVAFSYDMIGFVDSKQFPHEFQEPMDKLWAVDSFAFQLWNSIRSVDFVQSLPYVDKGRIGCTGASGGGTQTFSLCAVDDRITAAAPVNIMSCSIQADCICESPPVMRMNGISDMEIAATFAPKPLLMVSATGDWTVETPRVEYPAVRSVYTLCNATDQIDSIQIDAKHNYNKSSREAVYRFFGKYLLNQGDKFRNFVEPPFTVDADAALRIFPDNKAPAGYPSKDDIIRQTKEAARARWKQQLPKSPADAERFRRDYRPALAAIMGAEIPDVNAFHVDRVPRKYALQKSAGIVSERLVLRRKDVGDGIPMIVYRADDATPRDAVLVVNGGGKAALADLASGKPGPLVQGLLDQGKCVATIDVFLRGEHQSPFAAPVVRATGAFPDTFEPTDTACRVQDVITSVEYLRTRRDLSGKTQVLGLGDGGLWCLFAAALDEHIERVACDANAFPNNDDSAWVKDYYVPSLRSLGDVVTAAALVAPRPLLVSNTGAQFSTTEMQSVYTAVRSAAFKESAAALAPDALAKWFE